jgi:hypothetical protein
LIPLKNQNTLSKKYCKTRRAWPLLPWKPTYLCFAFFGFILFGVVAGVCRRIDKSSKGNKKQMVWGSCVGLVFIALASAFGGQAALHGFVLP